MTQLFPAFLRRFAKDQRGAIVVPFLIWAHLVLGVVLTTIELGAISLRHYALERALEDQVRDMRLGTGEPMDHAALKAAICADTTLLPNCEDALQLEMLRLDLRSWTAPPQTADCVDRSGTVTEPRAFETGLENEVMMLRACYKFTPILPTSYLSSVVETAADGASALVSTSAFVQEPS